MRRILEALLIYEILFAIFFFLSIYNFYNNLSFIDIGIPNQMVNMALILFSFAGMAKTAYHIITC